jgi:hypothetical protein
MHLRLVAMVVVVVSVFSGIIISVGHFYHSLSIILTLLSQRVTLTLGDLHVFTGRHRLASVIRREICSSLLDQLLLYRGFVLDILMKCYIEWNMLASKKEVSSR